MRIGIDARLINETGVGRYITNLLIWLSMLDNQNEYVIYLPETAYEQFILPNERWQKRKVTIHWHTVAEQIVLPFVYFHDRLSLLHVPYFTIPILYPGKIICTIHDLTILHVKTGKATTLPLPLYYAKHLGYKIIVSLGIRRACHIITVSKTIAQEIRQRYHIPANKISVTYEGFDERIITRHTTSLVEYPYFLYVGNAYPHKNLEVILETIKLCMNEPENFFRTHNLKIIFVGKEDYFYRRMKQKATELGIPSQVVFKGTVSDEELSRLYQFAIATLFPSKMEGFGLPAIESLALDCRVIVSDIPVFREILGTTSARFVSSNSLADWKQALDEGYTQWKNQTKIWDSHRAKTLFLERFSWKQMTLDTLSFYEHCNRL